MAERPISCVFEKCLDCWSFKRNRGFFQCEFGLVPVILTKQKGKKVDKKVHCYGYLDLPGKEAPAKRKLLKKAGKFKRLKIVKGTQES